MMSDHRADVVNNYRRDFIRSGLFEAKFAAKRQIAVVIHVSAVLILDLSMIKYGYRLISI